MQQAGHVCGCIHCSSLMYMCVWSRTANKTKQRVQAHLKYCSAAARVSACSLVSSRDILFSRACTRVQEAPPLAQACSSRPNSSSVNSSFCSCTFSATYKDIACSMRHTACDHLMTCLASHYTMSAGHEQHEVMDGSGFCSCTLSHTEDGTVDVHWFSACNNVLNLICWSVAADGTVCII